jgi:hypothetical protein
MTKLEILKETYDYYNEDVRRRSISVMGNCEYLTSTGNMCAVGRCLIDPKKYMDLKINSIYQGNNFEKIKDSFQDDLKEKYKGHSFEFWQDVQDFHDRIVNWRPKITKEGQEHYNQLVQKYII